MPGDETRLTAAANRDGAVAQQAEADKRARYPEGRWPWHAVPLAQEAGGRHGRSALQHLRKLARAQAARLDEGSEAAASALVLRWGCWLSVALHRANHETNSRRLARRRRLAPMRASSPALWPGERFSWPPDGRAPLCLSRGEHKPRHQHN